jgi:ABC-type multidrug transport system ATPase subunit
VLDEAFNGLDPASALVLKHDLHDRVAAGRCAVLLATHALDIVLRYASRAALLLDGTLARTWDRNQLEGMRAGAPEALDFALAEAAAASSSVD